MARFCSVQSVKLCDGKSKMERVIAEFRCNPFAPVNRKIRCSVRYLKALLQAKKLGLVS